MKGGTQALYPGTTGADWEQRQLKADKVSLHCATALISSTPETTKSFWIREATFICAVHSLYTENDMNILMDLNAV